MTSALQLEILDLRHFSANSLRPVLEEESRVWSERLHWDYRSSADLLLQYLDSRVLPGYVALENGRITGYAFCVYEDRKAVIGDVFALPPHTPGVTAAQVEAHLLEHLIELLQNSPDIERIESQLLLHAHDKHSQLFWNAGFQVYRRLFMQFDLQEKRLPESIIAMPPRLAMRPWHDADFNATGHLIADAYAGHLDSFINDQYRSVAGSLRFLHNIVRFPGCGYFDPQSSRVVTRSYSNEIDGVLLCSRVREDVGHVTQVCVQKSCRGLGLGRLMMQQCAASLQARGFQSLTLTVTEENQNAVALYRELGFEEKHSFDAMMWTRK